MAGRKGPKARRTKHGGVSADLKKPSKKLEKRKPANHFDPNAVTTLKQLNYKSHDVKHATIAVGDVLQSKWTKLSGQLRDGLYLKRLDALSSITALLISDPPAISAIGIDLLQQLTPRLIDDNDLVRNSALTVVGSSVFGLLEREASVENRKHFCEASRPILWSQLRVTLSHLHPLKKLDGLRLMNCYLQKCHPSTFGDPVFVTRILPLFWPHLVTALRPGRIKPIKKSSAPAGAQKPYQGCLEPCFSPWGALIIVNLLCTFMCLTIGGNTKLLNISAVEAPPQSSLQAFVSQALTSHTNASRADDCSPLGCTFLDFAINLVIGATAQMEDTSMRAAVMKKISGVCLSSIAILRWVFGFRALADHDRSTRLDIISSPLSKCSSVAREFCRRMFPDVENDRADQLILRGRKNRNLVVCLQSIFDLTSTMGSDQKQTILQELSLLIWSIFLCNSGETVSKQLAEALSQLRSLLKASQTHVLVNSPEAGNIELADLPSPRSSTRRVLAEVYNHNVPEEYGCERLERDLKWSRAMEKMVSLHEEVLTTEAAGTLLASWRSLPTAQYDEKTTDYEVEEILD